MNDDPIENAASMVMLLGAVVMFLGMVAFWVLFLALVFRTIAWVVTP